MERTGVQLDGSTIVDIRHLLYKINNTFTYEFWVKPLRKIKISKESCTGITGIKGQKYVVGPQYGSKLNQAGLGVSVGTNGICVYEHTQSHLPATLSYKTEIKQWCHVAVVYKDRIPYLYINGELKKKGLKSLMDIVFASGLFGAHDSYGFFEGTIDELRLWDHARTQEQIKSSLKNPLCEKEKGLIVHWNSNHFITNNGRTQLYVIKYPAQPKESRLIIESENGREGQISELEPNSLESISIVIPTFNAMSGYDFLILLSMLQKQNGFKQIEIIVVDSGSTDGTNEFAQKYGAKVIQISQEEFSHSYARNLGAEHALHPYILFITQDILPPSEYWLSELFTYMKNNDLAAVSCVETPREDADLFYRTSSWLHHYNFLDLQRKDKVLCKPENDIYLELRKNASLTDMTCLIKKEIFMKYKYRHNFAEDLDLGVRLNEDGYKLGLMVSAKVIHSHNRSPYYYLKRAFVDTIALSDIFKDFPLSNIKFKPLVKDILYTYHCINTIFSNDSQTTKNIKLEDYELIVVERFKKILCSNYPRYISLSQSKYIDYDFFSFLKEIEVLYFIVQDQIYDGNLIGSLLSWIKISGEYTHQVYDFLDEKLMEDYIESIYKAFASNVGTMLAQCYKTNNLDANLSHIIKNLKKGV